MADPDAEASRGDGQPASLKHYDEPAPTFPVYERTITPQDLGLPALSPHPEGWREIQSIGPNASQRGRQYERDPDGPCPHCPDGHGDPATRPWAVFVALDRDRDGQPTHLYVTPAEGYTVTGVSDLMVMTSDGEMKFGAEAEALLHAGRAPQGGCDVDPERLAWPETRALADALRGHVFEIEPPARDVDALPAGPLAHQGVGELLNAMLNPQQQPGPPWTHTFQPRPQEYDEDGEPSPMPPEPTHTVTSGCGDPGASKCVLACASNVHKRVRDAVEAGPLAAYYRVIEQPLLEDWQVLSIDLGVLDVLLPAIGPDAFKPHYRCGGCFKPVYTPGYCLWCREVAKHVYSAPSVLSIITGLT